MLIFVSTQRQIDAVQNEDVHLVCTYSRFAHWAQKVLGIRTIKEKNLAFEEPELCLHKFQLGIELKKPSLRPRVAKGERSRRSFSSSSSSAIRMAKAAGVSVGREERSKEERSQQQQPRRR